MGSRCATPGASLGTRPRSAEAASHHGSGTGRRVSERPESRGETCLACDSRSAQRFVRNPRPGKPTAHGHPEPADMHAGDGACDRADCNSYSAVWIHGCAFSLGACGFRVWPALPREHSLTVAKVTAGVGLGDHGPPGVWRAAGMPVEVMFPVVRHDRRTLRKGRAARRAAHGSVCRDEHRWALPGWHVRGCRDRAGLWCSPPWPGGGEVTSRSATASGSPNRLLCPDSVRYMSVIIGPAEPAFVCRGGRCRGSNV